MNKVYLLGSRQTIDKSIQVVEINQVIRMEGYSYDKYVVYDITRDSWGVHYHLINLRTLNFDISEIIRPLSQKFGIGMYYDENNIEFKTERQVAELLVKAKAQETEEQKKEQIEKERVEAVKAIGREWLQNNLPANAQAVIVAHLKLDESDSQTDYFSSRTMRTVILGFSTHKRDIFSEMRKYASNFDETAYLSEYKEECEHREKYSMGAGYYLGESKYSGWIIEKVPVYERSRTIEDFAYTAGYEDNIHIRKTDNTPPSDENGISKGNCTLVEYSDKALAVFGDTKSIKDELKAMGGRFNSRLTFKGEKIAGWVFPKSKEQRLAYYFGLN